MTSPSVRERLEVLCDLVLLVSRETRSKEDRDLVQRVFESIATPARYLVLQPELVLVSNENRAAHMRAAMDGKPAPPTPFRQCTIGIVNGVPTTSDGQLIEGVINWALERDVRDSEYLGQRFFGGSPQARLTLELDYRMPPALPRFDREAIEFDREAMEFVRDD